MSSQTNVTWSAGSHKKRSFTMCRIYHLFKFIWFQSRVSEQSIVSSFLLKSHELKNKLQNPPNEFLLLIAKSFSQEIAYRIPGTSCLRALYSSYLKSPLWIPNCTFLHSLVGRVWYRLSPDQIQLQATFSVGDFFILLWKVFDGKVAKFVQLHKNKKLDCNRIAWGRCWNIACYLCPERCAMAWKIVGSNPHQCLWTHDLQVHR